MADPNLNPVSLVPKFTLLTIGPRQLFQIPFMNIIYEYPNLSKVVREDHRLASFMNIRAKIVNQILANKIQQLLKNYIPLPNRGIPGIQDGSILGIPLYIYKGC